MIYQKKYNGYLYCDDAHGTSIIGNFGCGYALHSFQEFDDKLILISSLSKAFGSHGACVSLKHRDSIEFLKKYSHGYVFSGPPCILGVIANVASSYIHLSSDIINLQRQLSENIRLFNSLIHPMKKCEISPIKTIEIGSTDDTINVCNNLKQLGILTTAAIYPTVVRDKGLIRIALSSGHTYDQINYLAKSLNNLQGSLLC